MSVGHAHAVARGHRLDDVVQVDPLLLDRGHLAGVEHVVRVAEHRGVQQAELHQMVEVDHRAQHVVVADPAGDALRHQRLGDLDLVPRAREQHELGFVADLADVGRCRVVVQDRVRVGAARREVEPLDGRVDAGAPLHALDEPGQVGLDERKGKAGAHAPRDEVQLACPLRVLVGVGRLHRLADAVAQADEQRRTGDGPGVTAEGNRTDMALNPSSVVGSRLPRVAGNRDERIAQPTAPDGRREVRSATRAAVATGPARPSLPRSPCKG